MNPKPPSPTSDVLLVSANKDLPAPIALFPDAPSRAIIEQRYPLHSHIARVATKTPEKEASLPILDAAYTLALSRLERMYRVLDMQSQRQILEYQNALKTAILKTATVRKETKRLHGQISARSEVLRQEAELDTKVEAILKRTSRPTALSEIATIEARISELKKEESKLKDCLNEWGGMKDVVRDVIRHFQAFAERKQRKRSPGQQLIDDENDVGLGAVPKKPRVSDTVTPTSSPRPDLKTPGHRKSRLPSQGTPMSVPQTEWESSREEDGEIPRETASNGPVGPGDSLSTRAPIILPD